EFDHIDCDLSSADGCSRCRPRPSRLCCDVCNPSEFNTVAQYTPPEGSKAERKSRLGKYTRMEFENLLWRLLDDWRMVKAVEKYGVAIAEDIGPALVMPEQFIDRIVDCAHFEKIKNLQDLRRETGWNCPDEIGTTVVALVAEHGRPPAPPSPDSDNAPTSAPPRSVLTSNTAILNGITSNAAPLGVPNAMPETMQEDVVAQISTGSCIPPVRTQS
ncbi:hypothetical protein SCHPADRAFT_840731, partial [Schizopora paradoxa]